MKVLVVGGGSIGRRHLANLKTLGVTDLEVCEVDPSKLEELVRTFGLRGFAQFPAALDHRPDVVLVCTPTHDHLTTARYALEAGAHVFIEKPLAVSLEGTDELAARARALDRVVLIGCNMRFHPGVVTLKQALECSLVKRPWLFRAWFGHALANWRPGADYRNTYSARRDQGGGIIFEGVHEMDYLRWMAGEVIGVHAYARHVSDLDIDGEDTALVLLHFASGALGQIQLDYLSAVKIRGCEIVGADGMLRWVSEGKAPERIQVMHFEVASGCWKELYATQAYDGNEMYVAEMRHFLDCIREHQPPFVDIEEGSRVLRLTLSAREVASSSESLRPTGAT